MIQDIEQLPSRRTGELQPSNEQLPVALEKFAHDFDNALMPILGLTDYLLQQIKRDKGSPEQIEMLEIVLSAATDAQAILQRLRESYSIA